MSDWMVEKDLTHMGPLEDGPPNPSPTGSVWEFLSFWGMKGEVWGPSSQGPMWGGMRGLLLESMTSMSDTLVGRSSLSLTVAILNIEKSLKHAQVW